MTPEDESRNPKPERRHYDDDQSFEMAMWVWKQEVKNARAYARFNKKVDEKFNTKPASDGESDINPSDSSPTPTKQERVKARAEIKNDAQPSATPDPVSPAPTKTTNNAKIEDIEPQSKRTRSKKRSPLGPIKRELANISKNASTSARNSGVIRTQILGPINERLANLGSSVRHATTRINQSERNLEEKIGKVSGIVKDVRSENGKLFDRLKSLRNIGNISRGVAKARKRIEGINERTKSLRNIGNISRGVAKARKRIEGINERTKIINKNVKILTTQPTDVEPQHQPGIMERAWTGLGTRLGLVKRDGNAALKNVRGTGNKAKIKSLNPRMSKIPDPGELPSQLGIEAKNIYDRYTSPWSTGTKSRILANMVMPGVTALPALARSITGTSKGRGIFKKRNKGKQDVSNAEKVEIKQDKSEQTEDLLEKLKNTVFKVRIVEGDDSLLLTGKKDKKDENGEDGLLKTLANGLLSGKMMSTIMSYITGPALGAIGTAALAIVSSPVFLAGAAVAVGYILGKVMEDLGLLDALLDKFPDAKKFLDDAGAGFEQRGTLIDYRHESRKAFEAAAKGEDNNFSKTNPLAQKAFEEGEKLKFKYDKMREDGVSEREIKKQIQLDYYGLTKKLEETSPNLLSPEYPLIQNKPVDVSGLGMYDKSGILKNNNISPSDDNRMFNPFFGLFNETSKKIEQEENTKQEQPAAPINVNSISNNVSTNNSSPTLLAPQSMFDAKQSYSRFGWLYA
jgi:hypothetical protein